MSKNYYPNNLCLHRLFEVQALKTPDAIAVQFNESSLTYSQLNKHANHLAHFLIKRGVSKETLIIIAMERSLEMIICVLAVLKAAGAYVPIDPFIPKERLKFIIEDTKAPIILTDFLELLVNSNDSTFINPRDVIYQNKFSFENPGISVSSACLVYVIYTSGSTGRPKGVMIEHEGVVSLMQSLQDRYPLILGETVLFQSPFGFDASVEEIFWPLSFGGTLVIASPIVHQDLNQLIICIHKNKINNIQFVPSLLEAFFQMPEAKSCKSLKRIFSGGEVLHSQIKELILETLPGVELYNDYGPTETTVSSLIYQCTSSIKARIPIGKAIANKTVYIVDDSLKLCDIGVPGELYIGGTGLARGYLNLPELTQKKFISNIFAAAEDKLPERNLRLYKTGDICRGLSDGNIEFMGRYDNQLKIRGFRVELGEVETVLMGLDYVMKAVVIVREKNQQKVIVAYVILKSTPISKRVHINDLYFDLKTILPDYMMPKDFVFLDYFPLTENGKIDLQALPEPIRDNYVSESLDLPQSSTEKILAEIWREFLQINVVGRYDDFFQLGGHSLLSIKIYSEINKRFSVTIPLNIIFEKSKLFALAEFIDKELKVEVFC